LSAAVSPIVVARILMIQKKIVTSGTLFNMARVVTRRLLGARIAIRLPRTGLPAREHALGTEPRAIRNSRAHTLTIP
jgi:hypothetical protein